MIDIILYFLYASIAGFILPFLAAIFFQKENRVQVILVLAALSILGACAGVAGGLSREPAVGTIIPAIIGLMGGVSTYIFGTNTSRGLIASFAATSLSIALFVGFTIGSIHRSSSMEYTDLRKLCAEVYSDYKFMSDPGALENFNKIFDIEGKGRNCKSVLKWNLKSSN